MKDYNKLIQNKLDKSFTIMLGVAAIIAFAAAVMLFVADIPKYFSILNFCAGLIFFIFFLNAKKIKTSSKIIAIIVITVIIAVVSFVGGSVTSAYLSILIISNVIAVLFLDHKKGVIISILTVMLFIGLACYSPHIDMNTVLESSFLTWALQVAGLVLLLVVLNTSAYYIKNHLIENIQDLEKAVERSNKLAYYDQLTGLPNAYKFKIDVEEIIKRNKKDGYIVFFDIKSMGIINATLGQEYGDKLLIEIAEVFRRQNAQNIYTARIGGNEFALWIDNVSDKELIQKLKRIVYELMRQNTVLNKKIYYYTSYSSFEYGCDTLEKCYQEATLSLAYTKNNNILDFVPYNDVIENKFRRKEMINDLIIKAIDNEEIVLYYQPKYDSRTNKVIGVEGLARWEDDKLGFVAPYEFLPTIESLNLAVEFGNYVIKRACSDFSKIQKKYKENVTVSINISPSHIINSEIVGTIKDNLDKYNIPPSMIILEITEDIIINGIDIVKPIIQSLKNLGVKISLDDFGSGFSSLSYLTQLELDELKVDKSFIDQIEKNEKINPLLENIMHLSERFGLMVIAEGVETKLQNDILKGLGFYYIQGYYFAKPEEL